MNIMRIGCYIFLSDKIHVLTNVLMMLLGTAYKSMWFSVAAILQKGH